ncbi:hypothetical protein E6R60_26630 [Streptomyces sp. A0642]|uniref:hypothetical protein n=1 Tax=Streptomyces sp. A0642 TaxID=2563100 RepID=UPI0010A26BF2|nr:hypothetical protein [Streptomyces sp. A0642]THA72509.1 hypothetical protein E6R60_26630 [Streptomyces sp. A0642]
MIAKSARAATVSRYLTTALTGTGITRGSHGYTVRQADHDTVEIEWNGSTGDEGLDTIAEVLNSRYDATRTTATRGRNSTYTIAVVRVTPGTPVADVTGTTVTPADVTGPYTVTAPWETVGRPEVLTAAEVIDMITEQRAQHGEATINRTTGVISLYVGKDRRECHTVAPATPEQIAAQRTEYERSVKHWADMAERHQNTADAHRRALKTATTERAHFINVKINTEQNHADGCRKNAAEAEAKSAALTPQEPTMPTPAPAADTVTVNLPGAFCNWFGGTSIASGDDDSDATCKAARIAYESGRTIKAGSGYYTRITATAPVLRLLAEYAGYCLEANGDESNSAEIAAATKVIERTRTALATLREAAARTA